MTKCEKCGKEMAAERAELGLTSCKECAPQGKPLGFMSYEHKTGGVLVTTMSRDVFMAAKGMSRREIEDL